MAGGNMGDLWFTLGVRSNIAATVNKALKELKDVDGAVSVLNEKLVQAQQAYKAALSQKGTDPKVLKSIRDEINAWSKGVDNALAYQGMLQKVNKELRNISTLRNISVGVDKSKLDEAENLLRKFRNDLTNVTFAKLGGTDSNTYLSKYRKALGLTLNDVHDRIEAFRKDNSLTDAATRTATLERALANVQKRLESIRQLQSEAAKGGYNANSLLSAGNRMRGVEGRISKMLADKDLLNNEAKYRTLLSDIGTAAAKAALDVEKYKTAKDKAVAASTTQGNIDLNAARLRDVTALLDRIQERYTAVMGNRNVGGIVQIPGDLPSKIQQLEDLRQKLLSLSNSDLGKKGIIERLLKTENFGTIRNEVNSLLRDMEKGIRQADKTAEQASNNQIRNTERIQAKIRSLYDLLAKAYEARNRGNALGMDTTRLDRDIEFIRGKMQELRNILSSGNIPATRGWKLSPDIEGRLSNIMRHIRSIIGSMGAAKTRTQEAASAARDLASAFDRVHNSASKSSSVLSDIKSLFLQGGIVFAAQQFANSIVKTGGDIVQQHIALRSILGDVQKADELFAQTQQLALQSPFKFQELNRDVKQLAAFGVDTDRLYDTTKRLADVASGLGVSFERLGLAYGQVKARSWLDGKELRQFAYAGLPMLQKIADLYNETGKNGRRNYTTSDVRTMITKRQVSFEDVDKVFQRLTDAGGQFYNLQFVLSETLLGRWNKLEDAWSIMLGKFADGQNIIGQVFATAINGATNLVLALDRVSPILLSFGAIFGAKSILGAIGSKMSIGVGAITRQMALVQAQQLKTYATAQMQKVAEGEITAEIAQQNVLKQRQFLTSIGVKDLTYAQLLAEGKISAFELGQLARRHEVSAALITQLRTMGLITAQQERLILLAQQEGNTRRGNAALMQLGAGSVMGKIGGFFTPGNVAMIGASVGLALWMGYKQWSDRIEQQTKNAVEHAKQQAKSLKDAISSAQEGGASDAAVRNMQEIVENSGLYTKSMQEQVEKATTLQEKYDALLNAMQEMQKVNESMQKYSTEAESGMKATSVMSYGMYLKRAWSEANNWQPLEALSDVLGFGALSDLMFNDDLNKNFEQYDTQRTLYDNSVTEMQQYAGQIHGVLEGIKKDYSDTYNEIQNKPFEEQLRILSNSDAWDTIVSKISENDAAFKGLSKTYVDNTDDVDSKWSEIVNDDIPRLMGELAYKRNQTLSEYRSFCGKNQDYTEAMIRDIVAHLNEGSSKTKMQLANVLIEFFGLAKERADAIRKEASETEYDKETNVGKQLLNSIVRKYGNGVITVADINKVAGSSDNYSKAKSNIQRQYNEANEEYVAARDAGASGSRLAALKAERDKWYKVATANGITVSSKSDKADASAQRKAEQEQRKQEQLDRKADQDSERSLRARLTLIKEAYATYQKYYKLLHNESEAAKAVSKEYEGRGLSNDDVAKIRSREGYMSLVDDYLTRARNIQYRRPADMKDRKDEDIAAGVQEKNQQDYDLLQEQITEFNSMVNRDLDEMSRKWSNYQNVLKATGSAELAARVSGLRNDMNGVDNNHYASNRFSTGFVQTFSQYLQNYLDSLILSSKHPDKAIDYKALFGMSDKEIENYAGELFGADDKEKIDGFATAFKKLRDLITDTEFKEGIDAFNELMNKIVTQAAQQAKNDQDYFDVVNKLTNRFMAGDLSKENYDKALGIADTVHETQNLEAEDAYKQFMERVGSMTDNAATEMYNKAKANLDKQYKNGIITLKQYTDGIMQLNDQMEAFKGQKSNTFSFLTGGLNGYFQNKINKGQLSGNADMVAKGKKGASTVAIVDAIVNGINSNVQSYKKLEDTWTDAFGDGLKNSGFSRFMGGFTEASQGAADTWNSLKNGDFVGVLEGGIRSFTGWFSWGNAAANRRWEKQAEYLKGFQTTLNEINSNLKSKISSDYGSLSSTYANELRGNLRNEASEVRKTYYDWSQAHTIHRNHRNRMYTNLDYDAINSYLRSIGYNGGSIGGDSIQNLNGEWLEKIREHFAGQWSKLPDEAKEYLNRLIEIEGETGEITEATEAWKDAITGINKDSIVSDYASLLNDLDSSNDDFADSLEEKLRSAILNAMVANLYKKQLENLRDLAASAAGTEKGNYYVDKNGNIKQHTGGDDTDVASEYTSSEYENIMSQAEVIAQSARDLRNFFKDYYGWSDSSSSSASSSIKGITEEEAGVGLSYLNAMRADLSIIRQQLSLEFPSLNITAQAQLQQLNQISTNTLRNADTAERIEVAVNNIYDMFNRTTNGAKPIGVKVY